MAELDRTFSQDFDLPFAFERKPIPVPAEARPQWKVAELLTILHVSSRGGKSSLKRLHLLNWAVRSSINRRIFADSRNAPGSLFRFNVRFEPAFSQAIDLATGFGMVQWVGGDRVQLSAKGSELAQEILAQPDTLSEEKTFLSGIGKSVTEKEAEHLLGLRSSS